MLHFATLFDSNYLAKGLALYNSIKRHSKDFRLYILCLDDAAYDYLTGLGAGEIKPIRLSEIEQGDDALLTAKNNRSKVEYYFTLSPVWPLYLLKEFNDIPFITTLDADIYFFSDPSPVFSEFENKSVLISPHRFSLRNKHHEANGLYNVSFQIFRNDSIGLECLRQWRDQCIEWCYDRVEAARFADQKYLDAWPSAFDRVGVLEHEGAALAPWNVDRYEITVKAGAVYSNKSKLVFYHFHGLKPMKKNWFIHGVDLYGGRMSDGLMNEVYRPYINELVSISKTSGSEAPGHPLRIKQSKQTALQIVRSYSTLMRFSDQVLIKVELSRFFDAASRLKRMFRRN